MENILIACPLSSDIGIDKEGYTSTMRHCNNWLMKIISSKNVSKDGSLENADVKCPQNITTHI